MRKPYFPQRQQRPASAHVLYRRSDCVSSHLGNKNSVAYYEAVTDLMFSLLLLIARPVSYDRSLHWRTVCCLACHRRYAAFAASIGSGGVRREDTEPNLKWESQVDRSELADKEEDGKSVWLLNHLMNLKIVDR